LFVDFFRDAQIIRQGSSVASYTPNVWMKTFKANTKKKCEALLVVSPQKTSFL
jgi:hypothetical protein